MYYANFFDIICQYGLLKKGSKLTKRFNDPKITINIYKFLSMLVLLRVNTWQYMVFYFLKKNHILFYRANQHQELKFHIDGTYCLLYYFFVFDAHLSLLGVSHRMDKPTRGWQWKDLRPERTSLSRANGRPHGIATTNCTLQSSRLPSIGTCPGCSRMGWGWFFPPFSALLRKAFRVQLMDMRIA